MSLFHVDRLSLYEKLDDILTREKASDSTYGTYVRAIVGYLSDSCSFLQLPFHLWPDTTSPPLTFALKIGLFQGWCTGLHDAVVAVDTKRDDTSWMVAYAHLILILI